MGAARKKRVRAAEETIHDVQTGRSAGLGESESGLFATEHAGGAYFNQKGKRDSRTGQNVQGDLDFQVEELRKKKRGAALFRHA